MRRYTMCVFDDSVPGGGTAYTTPDVNERLGLPDALAIQALVDNVTGASQVFTVQIQHSADGRNWVDKPSAAIQATLSTSSTNNLSGSDNGSTPSFRFVRLAISVTGTSPVHAKVDVTARDEG